MGKDYVSYMTKETRSALQKYLHNVAVRAEKRAETRTFKRKRIMVLHALRRGILVTPRDAISLLDHLELPHSTEEIMGVTTIKSLDCPDIIFSNAGVYIGKQFRRRRRKAAVEETPPPIS